MSRSQPPSPPGIQSIFDPSDFSAASEVAFAHALKMALVTQASLRVLHVAGHGNVDWTDFPGVRETLERWQLIPKGSRSSAVADLGITVRKVVESSSDPVKASLEYLGRHPADLIILAVHQRDQRMRWLGKAVGEPIARGAGEMTLFIPHGVKGFVSREDGAVSLRNILVPVAQRPRPLPQSKPPRDSQKSRAAGRCCDAAARRPGGRCAGAETSGGLHLEMDPHQRNRRSRGENPGDRLRAGRRPHHHDHRRPGRFSRRLARQHFRAGTAEGSMPRGEPARRLIPRLIGPYAVTPRSRKVLPVRGLSFSKTAFRLFTRSGARPRRP